MVLETRKLRILVAIDLIGAIWSPIVLIRKFLLLTFLHFFIFMIDYTFFPIPYQGYRQIGSRTISKLDLWVNVSCHVIEHLVCPRMMERFSTNGQFWYLSSILIVCILFDDFEILQICQFQPLPHYQRVQINQRSQNFKSCIIQPVWRIGLGRYNLYRTKVMSKLTSFDQLMSPALKTLTTNHMVQKMFFEFFRSLQYDIFKWLIHWPSCDVQPRTYFETVRFLYNRCHAWVT